MLLNALTDEFTLWKSTQYIHKFPLNTLTPRASGLKISSNVTPCAEMVNFCYTSLNAVFLPPPHHCSLFISLSCVQNNFYKARRKNLNQSRFSAVSNQTHLICEDGTPPTHRDKLQHLLAGFVTLFGGDEKIMKFLAIESRRILSILVTIEELDNSAEKFSFVINVLEQSFWKTEGRGSQVGEAFFLISTLYEKNCPKWLIFLLEGKV